MESFLFGEVGAEGPAESLPPPRPGIVCCLFWPLLFPSLPVSAKHLEPGPPSDGEVLADRKLAELGWLVPWSLVLA